MFPVSCKESSPASRLTGLLDDLRPSATKRKFPCARTAMAKVGLREGECALRSAGNTRSHFRGHSGTLLQLVARGFVSHTKDFDVRWGGATDRDFETLRFSTYAAPRSFRDNSPPGLRYEGRLVGARGIEPRTLCTSSRCSTAELHAYIEDAAYQQMKPESIALRFPRGR